MISIISWIIVVAIKANINISRVIPRKLDFIVTKSITTNSNFVIPFILKSNRLNSEGSKIGTVEVRIKILDIKYT